MKQEVPGCFVFLGGHSVSFVAEEVLEQARGAVDAVVRGEGEPAVAPCWRRCATAGWKGCRASSRPPDAGPRR
ncbi:hypothetical protein SGRIM128S_07414 [Streptomyces griseomycini]